MCRRQEKDNAGTSPAQGGAIKCPYDPDYKGKDMFLPILGPVEGIYAEPELRHIRMLYAEKVTMVYKWVGYLLDHIRALGLAEDTLVTLLSDHGEPMGNGEHGHGIMRKCRPWPYEELAHAPLIMRGPGLPAGNRVSAFTQSCDVTPTLTDWLGIGVHREHQGRSLLPLARGEVGKVRDFAIAGYHRFSASIITDDWSFVHWTKPEPISSTWRSSQALKTLANIPEGEEMWTCTPSSVAEVPERDELYDRKADPCQLNNVAGKDPGRAAEFYAELRAFMAGLRTI